ncbi:MAG: T9SS type A sorting domain-containing protein [Chitinophagales bacterium]|nr:T9SS type A sorting domain-containing protein [Chitinophagales bacterium]
MKFFLQYIIFSIAVLNVVAQNLVPNPSFEEYSDCPTTLSQIDHAIGWMSFKESPDYFNSCAVYPMNVPHTAMGFQLAFDGNTFAGIINTGNASASGNNGREYFGIQLSQLLTVGVQYFVSMKVILAAYPGRNCAINNLGAKFTTFYVNAPDDNLPSVLITNSAQIYSQSILDDSINWITISGSFVADSAYKYIVIGNFFDDAHTDTLHCLSTAYYFVDEVCVSADSLNCIGKDDGTGSLSELNGMSVSPNMSNDKVIVEFGNTKINAALIVNLLGNTLLIQNISNQSQAVIDISSLSAGTYFLILHGIEKDFVEKIIKTN